MPQPSYYEGWDDPGGPGRRRRGPTPGVAQSLYVAWREAVDEIADAWALKATVKPQVFNTFCKDRRDQGVTDEQLSGSFVAFAAAVSVGFVSARHGDLWGLYASTWSRWVHVAPAATRRPLRGRDGSPRRQR